MAIVKKASFRVVCCFSIIFLFGFISHVYAIDLSSEENEYLRAKSEIVFVSQTRYPPFEFTDANHQHEGMMLDVIRWMAVEMGFKPVFTDMTFQQAQEAVLSGKADILTSLFYSEKRKENFEFTETLFEVPASIFVRAERTDMKDLKDLNGKTIAMQRGDYAKDFLESQKIGFETLETKDFADATDMVIAGKADAVIGDEQIVLYHIFSNRLTDYTKKIGGPLYIGRNCMASNKNNAILIGILNKGIGEAIKSGALDKISKKWLGTKYGPQESFLERHLWHLSAVGGGLLWLSLAVWAWNVRLRTLVRRNTEVILCREEALRQSEEALSTKHRELQETAQRLEQSRNMLQLIIESIPVRVFWKDKNLRYLGCNTLFARDAGLNQPQQLLGLDDFALGWREQAELYRVDDRQVMESCSPKMNIVEPQTTPAGSTIWLNTSKVPLHRPNGEVFGVLGVYEDISERKRAEGALRESEELYRTLVSLSPDAISMTDPNSLLTFTSPKAREMFGQSPDDEILGRSLLDWVAPDEQEKTSRNIEHLLTVGTLIDTEYTLIKKDGTSFIGEVNAAVIQSPDDSPMRMIFIIRDVTERKRAEETLSLRESYLTAITENQPGLVWLKDEEGRFLAVNHAFARSCGMERPEEVLGKTDLDIWPTELAEKYMADDKAVVTTGAPIAVEEAICDRGEIKWFETFKTPVLNKDGRILGTSGYARDITERKRSDAERTLLATAVEQAEENILVTDDRRTIIYINPAFERSSGYRSEELKGQKLKVLRSSQHDEAFYRNMKEILDRGEVWMGVIINRGKDGIDFEIEGTISPLRDASGSITQFLAVGRNMSRFRKLESELYQAQKMESVGRLAGGVAHDFNNMLGIILGHTEMALDRVTPDHPLFADLREIWKAAERSADLTRQLLAFARKQTVAPRVLDPNETVEGMLKMLRRLIGEDIDLAWLPGAGLWQVKVDPSQIDQILANLCVNARDAIAGVGKLTIKTENVTLDAGYCASHVGSVPGEYVLLAVSDDGPGMDKETLSRLFEPFFTTKGVGKGTGLGLATVYGIVKQNDGFIDVYSEPGQGTCFKIYLPRHKGKAGQMLKEGSPGPTGRGHETILLVEDEPAILKMTTMMLEHQGYTVLAAGTPGEAIRLAEAYPGEIQLLMTDVVMPEMNGRDLAKNLLALYPNLRRLFMSGYTANVIAHHGVLDAGVNFIQKPFSMRNLAAKLREVIGGDDE